MSFSAYPISEHFGQTLDNLIAANNFDQDNPLFQRIREENFSNLFPYPIQVAFPGQSIDFSFSMPSFPEISMIPNVAFLDQQMLYERNFTVEESLGNPYTEIASDNLRNYELFAGTSFTPQEYIQYQQNRQLLSPNSPIVNALGLKGYDLGFTHAFVDLHSIDSAEDFKQKTAAICSQVEQNKFFWSNALKSMIFVDPSNFELAWESKVKKFSDREYLTGEGFTDEEQIEMVLNRLQDVQAEADQMKYENESYPFLTNVPNSENQSVETVPFADKPLENQKGFEQALSDFDEIAAYCQNRGTYPEGSPERFPDDYLEVRIKGTPNSMGGNFGYFSGCFLKNLNNIISTNSSSIFVINTLPLELVNNPNINLPSKYQNALQIFGLSSLRSEKIKEAVVNGVLSSDIYTSALDSLVYIGKTGNYSRGLSNLDSSLNTKIFDAYCSDIPKEIEAFDSNLDILPEKPYLEKAKRIGSKICHVFLRELETCASYFAEDNARICSEFKSIFENLLPDSVFDAIGASDFESQLKASQAIHSRIDKFFSTNLAHQYSGAQFNTELVLGALPSMGMLLGRLRVPKTTINNVCGWKLGQPINNRTIRGNCPKWSTVRQRHWKNKAYLHENGYITTAQKYVADAENIARMKKGLAPQIYNKKTKMFESIELHHIPSQRDGGLLNFIEVTPAEHATIDAFRNLGS